MQADQSFERLLSPADVARRLGVGRAFVIERIKRNEIRAYRVGALWKIAPLELQRYLMNNRSDRLAPGSPDPARPEGGKL
jgi:excisionase family DNA binding protein